MRILSKPEVFEAIKQIKTIDETEGRKILEHFAKQHVGLQQMLFGGFPQAVAAHDKELSYLFMDLCFDIICVYIKLAGDIPENIATQKWLQKTIKQIEADVKKNPQTSIESYENTQIELLEYLTLSVDQFMSENNSDPDAATAMYNLLFLVTRIFDAIYDEEIPTVH